MADPEILIVEDDGIIAAHLEMALRNMGYSTAGIASSGEEALALAAAKRPGLALMDIGLRGGMDGIATAARLRERLGIPVIYLTAHTDDATLERAKVTEPAGYLSKPFHEGSLKATLTMALHKETLARRVRETERELRESEERYRLTFDQAAVGIAHVGLDMRILRANPRCCEIFGYTAAELSGMPIGSLVHPDDRALDVDARREIAAGHRQSFVTEKRFVRKDGAVLWARIAASLQRDAERRPEHIISVVDDITAQREAEEKLRLVSEEALVGVAILQDERVEFVNQACADIVGYSVDELLAMPAKEVGRLLHADGAPARREPTDDGPSTSRRVYRLTTRTGTGKWVDERSRTVLHRGRPAELLFLVDVSDLKRAEAALAEKSRHYQLLLQTSRDAVHVLDRNGKLCEHNAAFLEHLGYTAEEARSLSIADWAPQWSGSELRDRLAAFLRAPGRFETRHRRKDGSIRDVELTCAPFEEGGKRYIQASARDVTDRKRAEADLRDAREALERLNHELERRVAERTAELTLALRARDDFLSVMSHELRTPLHAMLFLGESLREGTYGQLQPGQIGALERLDERGRHLLDLITDILDVSRMDTDALRLDLTRVAIAEVCDATARLMRPSALRKHQTLTVSVRPELGAVRADGRRLKQILVNLLANAIKFTPEEGAIGLDATPQPGAAAVRFTVWDTGVGISEADRPRLFQRFGPLDTSLTRPQGGAGLGLSLVQRLTELHGGHVEVESQVGVGSRFTVVIPGWEEDA